MPNTHITLQFALTPASLEKYFGFTDEEIDHLKKRTPGVIDFEKLQARAARRSSKR